MTFFIYTYINFLKIPHNNLVSCFVAPFSISHSTLFTRLTMWTDFIISKLKYVSPFQCQCALTRAETVPCSYLFLLPIKHSTMHRPHYLIVRFILINSNVSYYTASKWLTDCIPSSPSNFPGVKRIEIVPERPLPSLPSQVFWIITFNLNY